MAIRTRKNVLTLVDAQGQWHPDLLWYARAITEMKKRPIADPTSWRYQAAIHDYVRQFDPLAQASDVLPPAAERQRFWGQCQHFSWFFLPWHRMYLLHFEQIVVGHDQEAERAAIGPCRTGTTATATIPDARRLPPAFRATLTPDRSPNPLLVDERNPGCNSGQIIADDSTSTSTTASPKRVCGTGDGRQSRIWRAARPASITAAAMRPAKSR